MAFSLGTKATAAALLLGLLVLNCPRAAHAVSAGVTDENAIVYVRDTPLSYGQNTNRGDYFTLPPYNGDAYTGILQLVGREVLDRSPNENDDLVCEDGPYEWDTKHFAKCQALVQKLNQRLSGDRGPVKLVFNRFGMLAILSKGRLTNHVGLLTGPFDKDLRAPPTPFVASFHNAPFTILPQFNNNPNFRDKMTPFYDGNGNSYEGLYVLARLPLSSKSMAFPNFMTFVAKCQVDEDFLDNGYTCQPLAGCPEGQERGKEPDFSQQRGCDDCRSGYYQNGNMNPPETCQKHSVCKDYKTPGGEYQASAPSKFANRVCKTCSTTCSAGSFIKLSCQAEEDIDCAPFRNCTSGTRFVLPNASVVNEDATCTPCTRGTYQDEEEHKEQHCKPVDETCLPGQRQSREPWVSWNRECVSCKLGETYQDQASTNAQCNPVSP